MTGWGLGAGEHEACKGICSWLVAYQKKQIVYANRLIFDLTYGRVLSA